MADLLTPLAAAFEYTPDDLKANRQGRLSGRQRRALWMRFWGVFLGLVLLVVVPIVLAWGLVLWSSDDGLSAAMNDTRAGLGYAVGAILGIFFAVANWPSLMMFFDLMRGRVRESTGEAHIWGRYLTVGDDRFVVGQDALNMLQPGLNYRVFLLPRSRTLLSIEFAE